YECADGKWIALAASEQQFYVKFREVAGFNDDPEFDLQRDRGHWPTLKAKVTARLKEKTRDEWLALFDNVDACFTPVLDMSEAPDHPHNLARGVFTTQDGVVQPQPAPRFSATPGKIQGPPPEVGQHAQEILGGWGFSGAELAS